MNLQVGKKQFFEGFKKDGKRVDSSQLIDLMTMNTVDFSKMISITAKAGVSWMIGLGTAGTVNGEKVKFFNVNKQKMEWIE